MTIIDTIEKGAFLMNEIEKKFLVKSLPDLSQYPYTEIQQGYISCQPEIRIRQKDNQFFLTQKGEGTLIRSELETELTNVAYQILSTLIVGRLIEKQRYTIPLPDGNIAELDIYKGDLNGFVTVEVEFPTEIASQNFVSPEWFGSDITEDKRYKNKNLATATEDQLPPFNKIKTKVKK